MTQQNADERLRALPHMDAQPRLDLVRCLEVTVHVLDLAILGHRGAAPHPPHVQRLVQKAGSRRQGQHEAGEEVVLVHDSLVEPKANFVEKAFTDELHSGRHAERILFDEAHHKLATRHDAVDVGATAILIMIARSHVLPFVQRAGREEQVVQPVALRPLEQHLQRTILVVIVGIQEDDVLPRRAGVARIARGRLPRVRLRKE